ncbi:MAG TPA: histidine kinase [Chryseosolibacter sp.]|nr:histidine kinase [Chryseosolibacter sp.]
MKIAVFLVTLLSLSLVYCLAQGQNKKAEVPSKVKERKLYSSGKLGYSAADLLDEAVTLRQTDPQQALDKVEEALAISITRSDVVGEAKSYLLLGDINMQIEEWKLALDNYTTAYDKLKDKYSRSIEFQRAIKGIGDANLKLGNFQQALDVFKQGLDPKASARLRAERQLDISEAYYQLQDYRQAMQVLEEIKYTDKDRDPGIELRLDNQKAKVFAQLNDIGRARESYESSQRIINAAPSSVSPKDLETVEAAKEEISTTLQQQKRYDEQIDLLSNSIAFNTLMNNPGNVTEDKVELGKALAAIGESGAAIRELEEAASIADTIDDPRKQATAFLSLAELYDQHGNSSRALRSYKKYSNAVRKSEEISATKLMEKSELLTRQRNIEEVAKYVSLAKQDEQIAQAMVSRQRLVIYGLMLIIGMTAITSYFIYKNAQASKKANQLLALKSLRSQMNPHFIFNALNSMNHFVSLNDERTANKFLSEFSRLMRLVLENSQEDFIPLFKEEEIISLYLKLEHYRFRDKFDYSISIDEEINKEVIHVPPMLIQPYIENAVWHGLRYRDTKGFVSVEIHQHGQEVIVTVTDNGIGRKRSAELKTENQKKHNSTGLKNIRERLNIINRIYRADYKVFIEDLPEGQGTRVKLHLPVNKKTNAYA